LVFNHGAGENIEEVRCQTMLSELRVRECGSKGTVITVAAWVKNIFVDCLFLLFVVNIIP
jgi:hypothetical protein